jgi:phosphoesterase RecJ-like protein
MTRKVKILAPKIWEKIQKCQKALMHLPPSPDGDAVGAVLAMMHLLKGIDKEVTVIGGDSSLPQLFGCLPGFDQIISKNYFQVDPKEFDLFLLLDTSSLNQVSKIAEVIFPEELDTVVIDHHDTTSSDFGKINLVEASASSTCEILYELMKEWPIKITPQMAICLFAGIYIDTGGFKYSKTGPGTFITASKLVKIYPGFSEEIFKIENSNQPQKLQFIGLALSSIEKYFLGKVAIAVVPFEELKKRGIEKRHTEKMEISNMIKSVVGWETGVSFIEVEPGVVNLSLRTRDPLRFNVGRITLATGFGGGHASAAGATLKMPFTKAKKFLLETIKKVYPELGEP